MSRKALFFQTISSSRGPAAVAFVLTALLLSCDRPSKAVAQPATSSLDSWLPAAPPQSRAADDAARFLAGLPGKPGTAFAALEQTDAWAGHRKELDVAWNAIEAKTMGAMREFQKTELSAPAAEKSTVFYPFSGPDSLIMSVFYPRNPVYIMVGLEPPGTLPDPKQFPEKTLSKKLADSRETVYSVLHRSFFITRQMDRQFRGQVTDGLFPPILNLLVRENRTIVGYRYVRINDDGNVVERPEGEKVPDRGIEVDFTQNGSSQVQRLFYFSVNLSDKSMQENQPFLKFLDHMKGCSTFMKATSYMTHHADFSMIRDRILANSATVLQDDSGIPYKYFTGAWNVQLFGGYEKPYGSFRWLEQPDLRKAYNTNSKPLAFKIGYGFSRIPSNLQLARQAAPTGK